ncbi:unnamed protein product [Urochloa decumbens]|uniref:Protein TIFY n=1 Tax=Urochloa decumbens TaxID=240449 RepID=A0ABC9EDX6_9POAL
MELDLLGLGLLPATAAAAGHGGSAAQRPDSEKACSNESPIRLAAAATEAPSPARGRMRRRPADTDDAVVAAPPATKLKPPSTAPSSSRKVRVPGAAGDRSPRASQLVFFRGMFPPAPGDLAATGQAAQVHHAIAARTPPPPLIGVSALAAANGFGRPPPHAAGPIFERSVAASSSTDPDDHSTAPLTIIYAGSVRAFDSVPMEQAEKILFMTAKEAQAAETPAFPQPDQPAAAIPSSSAAQMMMLLGLANANDSLLPKRTASLARFLHRRKQRVERAATMPYPCGEVLPAQQVDPSTAAYARDIEHTWASEDGPKSMKENHGEEAVNTDLKI